MNLASCRVRRTTTGSAWLYGRITALRMPGSGRDYNGPMGIRLNIKGNDSRSDRLFASVAGRRFPARVEVTNTGPETVEVELRMRAGSGAMVRIADSRLSIGPGSTAATSLQAETPSKAAEDTVLQVLAGGRVEAELRLTVVSLARESVFHNLVPKQPA